MSETGMVVEYELRQKENRIKHFYRLLVLLASALCIGGSLWIGSTIHPDNSFLNSLYIILINSASALIGFIAARYVVGPDIQSQNNINLISKTAKNIKDSTEYVLNESNKQNQLIRKQCDAVNNAVNKTERSLMEIQNAVQSIKRIEGALETIRGPNTLNDINFDHYIERSCKIELVVQSWGSWIERHERSLKRFFENGGKFTLLVTSPDSTSSSYIRELMEKRLCSNPESVIEDINKTISELSSIKDESNNENCELEIIKLGKINWYFGAMFSISETYQDTDKLVLSVYGHTKQGSPWNLPALLIDASSRPNIRMWFEKDLESLRETQ